MLSTIERQWVLLFVEDGCPAWNPGNPLVGQIPDQSRDFILERASKLCGTSEDVELSVWEEFTMNGRWLNPAENIINCLAITYIGIRFPHVLASIEGVLRDCRLPADSLTCLDGDDFSLINSPS